MIPDEIKLACIEYSRNVEKLHSKLSEQTEKLRVFLEPYLYNQDVPLEDIEKLLDYVSESYWRFEIMRQIRHRENK